jgi:hypothetical protein
MSTKTDDDTDRKRDLRNSNNKPSTLKKRGQQASIPITNIQQAQNSMQVLLNRVDKLQYSPPTVASLSLEKPSVHNDSDVEARDEIIHETKQFFRDVCHAVEKGTLSPSRKHGKDLSRLMECVLYIYSCCVVSPDGPHLTKECQRVLDTLKKDWNLDIQNAHYDCAIAVANQQRDFAFASRLFDRQIDPNAGNTVVPIDIDNPQGLFAIARLYSSDLQADHDPSSLSSAAEHVMDAVQRLVMVSPQDQATYVLAAGNALGYAGRWQDLREYWKNSFLSQQYGTPLVAAVMQACWLCGRSREAWQVLEESNLLVTPGVSNVGVSTTPGFGGEWQYGGERDLMDPLVRDLAMRVIPDAWLQTPSHNSDTDGNDALEAPSKSDIALRLYHQTLAENVTISREALLGVVMCCEQDERWQEALSVLMSVFDEEKRLMANENIDPWIVPGNRLVIEERGHQGVHASNNLLQMSEMLASVMRNCNASSHFGISLFCLQLFDMLLSMRDGGKQQVDHTMVIDEQIGHFLSRIEDPQDVLTASMVALCGLRCYKQAIDLYNHVEPEKSSSMAASMVNKYAMSNQARFGTLVLGNPWVSAQRHTEQLLLATRLLAQNGTISLSDDPRKMQQIEHILGRAMNSCTNAHQPELSLQLLRWTNQSVLGNGNVDSPVSFNDAVTAETILARRWAQDAAGAVDLFEDVVQSHEGDLSARRMTTAAGLTALIANGRDDDALTIFRSLEDSALCTDGFTTIGHLLLKRSEWREVIDLYRCASMKGFSSEELSLMAMKAVSSSKIDNRLRILRAIADECASNVGTDVQTWMTSRYWHIKRELGFYYARLLMWWNDPDLALVDELNLAIKEFYNELSNDLRPKNDVVRVIVEGPKLLKSIGLEDLQGYERVPRTVEQWSSLLVELIEATRGSSIQYDPNFVDSMVRAYKSLGRNRDCVDYISDLMDADGIRVRKSTLSEALEAARLEQAMGLYKDIEMKLSQRKSSNQDHH